MSIEDLIIDRVRRGMLFTVLPRAPGTPTLRAMFAGEQLWKVLTSPEGDDAWEKRVGELQADLERFVEGQEIDPNYLYLLSPTREGVWEIRSVRPDPQIRVLGLFAGKDIFIATNHAFRGDLGTEWDSRAWRDAKRESRRIWEWLFHDYKPMITTKVREVVSRALDGKYFKSRD